MTVHRSPTLVEQQIVVVNGLRCTNALRTILDLAAVTRTGPEYKLLRRALRQATTKDHGLPARLANALSSRGGWPGARVLASALDEHLESTAMLRSDLEAACLDLCLAARVPLPETNAIVEGHEVDAVWRVARVVVELDTYRYHGDVRAFERDRARDADLSVAGYRLIRITARRLERERPKIVRQLRALLVAQV